MKIFSILAFCSLAISSFAQETAYQALNAVGKVKGQTYLDNLLNLEGIDGGSQPQKWRMIFEDNGSRAGFREMEVRNGEIVSQRAPLKSPFSTSSRVNLDRLQLDSDGAFTVAEREAIKRRISFSTANYFLQAEGENGKPVWRVQLLDAAGNIVQTLRISADNGSVIGVRENIASSQSQSDYVESTPPETEDEPDLTDKSGDSTELKIHRGFVRFGRNIKNGFKHIGGSFQEIFTGERTIDKDLSGE